jgi:hypothetical protein
VITRDAWGNVVAEHADPVRRLVLIDSEGEKVSDDAECDRCRYLVERDLCDKLTDRDMIESDGTFAVFKPPSGFGCKLFDPKEET